MRSRSHSAGLGLTQFENPSRLTSIARGWASPYNASMKPENKKRLIGTGTSVIVVGVGGALLNHESRWVTAALVLIGVALIAQAMVMGRKPRA